MTRRPFLALATLLALGACSSVGIGISLPVGGLGHVGVSVDGAGRVGAQVGVGVGGARVGVGGTAQIPQGEAAKPAPAASAASAPGA